MSWRAEKYTLVPSLRSWINPAPRKIARLRDTDDCTESTTSCTSPTVNSSSASAARIRKRNGSATALSARTSSIDLIIIFKYCDGYKAQKNLGERIMGRNAPGWKYA